MTGLRLRIAAVYLLLIVTALAAAGVYVSERSIIVALVSALALALVTAIFISRSIFRPLSLISAAMRAVAAGDYAARIPSAAAGDLGELADSFNAMASQVQAQVSAASQERSRLAAALNSSVDAVVALGADTRVLFANLTAERLFGRPAGDIVGRPFAYTLPNDAIVAAVRSSHERGESTTNVIERPGRRFLQVVTTPIRGGGEWNVLVVFHDLTDVKRTEQVRRDFIANVSHELRTPLASIKSVIETLLGGALTDTATARDFLARADADTDRLIQLVEELLELSRIESGEIPLAPRPTDVVALLEDVLERLRPQAERKELTLTLNAGDLPKATIDATRIERAVANLVHNAIKFTDPGGKVELSASMQDGQLEISVRDTGIGIAAEDLPRIFERFYKADQSRSSVGRGLGLAIVRHAVEAHGGTVRAESTPGRGSTFRLSIPI